VNIGHLRPEKLTDFIEATEKALGIDAIKNFMPMQTGDVPAFWADNFLLQVLTGFTTSTDFKDGIQKFLSWSRDYEYV
jgi:UDP-glucuronate 4-epimerase